MGLLLWLMLLDHLPAVYKTGRFPSVSGNICAVADFWLLMGVLRRVAGYAMLKKHSGRCPNFFRLRGIK
jgi:hypothetical protein